MPIIETKRGPIFYVDHRNNTDTPLVLIHGAGDNHLDWPVEIQRLSNVILPDLPGHGQSPGAGRLSVDDYASDIVALLDALKIEKTIIGGMSMGGAIAQMITLTYPMCVERLILIVTGARLSVHDLILNGLRTDTEATARMIMKWMWTKSFDNQEEQESSVQRILEAGGETTFNDYSACDCFDVRDRLVEISVPTLVIGGEDDKMTPLALSEFLAEHIPNATLKVIKEGGHKLIIEQSSLVVSILRDWREVTRCDIV